MCNLLLIGASGFIGKRVLELIDFESFNVSILTRNREKYNDKNNSGRYCIYELDITCNIGIEKFNWEKFDVIINCSGELHDKNLMEELHVNSLHNILPRLKEGTHWIQLSSIGIYGDVNENLIINGMDFNPIDHYESTKALGDKFVESFCINNNLFFTNVRPSIVFANDMPNDSIRQLVRVIKSRRFVFFGNGENVYMNYIHADSVAKIILDSVGEEFRNKSLNISCCISLASFYNLVIEEFKMRGFYFKIPKMVAKPLVSIFSFFPGFPVTKSRYKALTNNVIYVSDVKFSESEFRRNLRSFINSVR